MDSGALRDERPNIDLDTAKFLLFGLTAIEGWGIDAHLARIFLSLNEFQRRRGVYGNLFEIGVHHGRTAALLALMSAIGEVSVFVDLFDRQAENIDASGRGDRETFEANLARWAPGRSVRIVPANSLELDFATVDELKDGLRFAHIDGAHYRAAVLNDIGKTRSVLIDQGVIVVDDFMHTGFPGVNEACNAYLEGCAADGVAPVAIGQNKLILTTTAAAPDLVAHIAAAGFAFSLADFHGCQVACLDPH